MYKPPYFEHWVHFVLLLSSGIKDFHFLPLVKNIKARVTTLSEQTKKQTNQPRRNVQIKQTNKQTNKQTKKLTFLKVITRQLPVQFRPSPLNPNKQVHTKDPFVFWQEAFRWQSWVYFWHSSISKKKGREKNNYAAVVAIIVTNQLLIQTKPKFPLQRNLSLNAIPNCSRVLAVKDRPWQPFL